RRRVAGRHCDLPPKEKGTVRTGRALGICGRHRCVVSRDEVFGSRYRGTIGEETLGAEAVHRRRRRWESVLLPPRLKVGRERGRLRLTRAWSGVSRRFRLFTCPERSPSGGREELD